MQISLKQQSVPMGPHSLMFLQIRLSLKILPTDLAPHLLNPSTTSPQPPIPHPRSPIPLHCTTTTRVMKRLMVSQVTNMSEHSPTLCASVRLNFTVCTHVWLVVRVFVERCSTYVTCERCCVMWVKGEVWTEEGEVGELLTAYLCEIYVCDKYTCNKFAKLSKARRDHWSLIIEDRKSLMKVGPPQKKLKLKKFKVKKFLSWEISMSEKV